jgi:hypothetical protein
MGDPDFCSRHRHYAFPVQWDRRLRGSAQHERDENDMTEEQYDLSGTRKLL